jgi:hypothetical protein
MLGNGTQGDDEQPNNGAQIDRLTSLMRLKAAVAAADLRAGCYPEREAARQDVIARLRHGFASAGRAQPPISAPNVGANVINFDEARTRRE